MSNHKAHFRGDIQVDGSIVGPDGQPIGGGSVDWSTPIPELHFAGDPADDLAGMSLAWSDEYYGLVIQGRPGSDDSELYLIDPDDPTVQTNFWPGGSSLVGPDGTSAYYGFGSVSLSGPYGGTNLGTGGVSFSAPTNGGVNIGGQGIGFLANPADFVSNELIKRRYFALGYYNESGSRFSITPDGELGWYDGTSFVYPDVTLEHSGAGSLTVLGQGGDNVELTVAAGDVIAGAHAAGGEDAYLEAYTGGTSLVLSGGHTGDADEIYFGQASWQATMYRHGGGLIGIRESGGGLVLHSPDGTAYKISVANGGALSAVAV